MPDRDSEIVSRLELGTRGDVVAWDEPRPDEPKPGAKTKPNYRLENVLGPDGWVRGFRCVPLRPGEGIRLKF